LQHPDLRSLDGFFEAYPHAEETLIATLDNFPDVLAERAA